MGGGYSACATRKVLQYTYNLHGSTPPSCIAVPSWLLSLEERETQEYTSRLYCSMPPICTAVRLPFVWQYFEKVLGVGFTRKFPNNAMLLSIGVSLSLSLSPSLPPTQ